MAQNRQHESKNSSKTENGGIRAAHGRARREIRPHKMDQAIVALMSKPTIGEAARSVGISESTLDRWIQEPRFAQAYQSARQAAFSHSVARLQEASSVAVTTLLELMRDKKTPAGLRLRAADIVLVHAGRAAEDFRIRAADKEPRDRYASRSSGRVGA